MMHRAMPQRQEVLGSEAPAFGVVEEGVGATASSAARTRRSHYGQGLWERLQGAHPHRVELDDDRSDERLSHHEVDSATDLRRAVGLDHRDVHHHAHCARCLLDPVEGRCIAESKGVACEHGHSGAAATHQRLRGCVGPVAEFGDGIQDARAQSGAHRRPSVSTRETVETLTPARSATSDSTGNAEPPRDPPAPTTILEEYRDHD